jgi:hypothetical protein
LAKYNKHSANNTIIWNLANVKLTKYDLCNILHTDPNTLNKWISQPGLMPLDKITLLAGLFGMYAEELVYLLRRNKPSLKKEGIWYLEQIREKHKNTGNDVNDK